MKITTRQRDRWLKRWLNGTRMVNIVDGTNDAFYFHAHNVEAEIRKRVKNLLNRKGIKS